MVYMTYIFLHCIYLIYVVLPIYMYANSVWYVTKPTFAPATWKLEIRATTFGRVVTWHHVFTSFISIRFPAGVELWHCCWWFRTPFRPTTWDVSQTLEKIGFQLPFPQLLLARFLNHQQCHYRLQPPILLHLGQLVMLSDWEPGLVYYIPLDYNQFMLQGVMVKNPLQKSKIHYKAFDGNGSFPLS